MNSFSACKKTIDLCYLKLVPDRWQRKLFSRRFFMAWDYGLKEFQQKAQNLRVALIGRGYKDKDILPHIDKASTYTQPQLLTSTPPTNTSRTLPFLIPHNPDLAPLPYILKQHWQYIENNPVLSQIWPNQPVMAYQRHKNLKEHFVHTKFTTP